MGDIFCKDKYRGFRHAKMQMMKRFSARPKTDLSDSNLPFVDGTVIRGRRTNMYSGAEMRFGLHTDFNRSGFRKLIGRVPSITYRAFRIFFRAVKTYRAPCRLDSVVSTRSIWRIAERIHNPTRFIKYAWTNQYRVRCFPAFAVLRPALLNGAI